MSETVIWEGDHSCGTLLKKGLYGVFRMDCACPDCRRPICIEVEPSNVFRFSVRTITDTDTDMRDAYSRCEAVADQKIAMREVSFRFAFVCTNCRTAIALRLRQQEVCQYPLWTKKWSTAPTDIGKELRSFSTFAFDEDAKKNIPREFQVGNEWEDKCWNSLNERIWSRAGHVKKHSRHSRVKKTHFLRSTLPYTEICPILATDIDFPTKSHL